MFLQRALVKTDQEIWVKRKLANETTEPLVQWSGYPDKFNSWITSNDVQHSRDE